MDVQKYNIPMGFEYKCKNNQIENDDVVIIDPQKERNCDVIVIDDDDDDDGDDDDDTMLDSSINESTKNRFLVKKGDTDNIPLTMLNICNNPEKMCRICGKFTDQILIPIFSELGMINNIPKIISDCLPITVSENEVATPKNICYGCINQLVDWHKLVIRCKETELKICDMYKLPRKRKRKEEKKSAEREVVKRKKAKIVRGETKNSEDVVNDNTNKLVKSEPENDISAVNVEIHSIKLEDNNNTICILNERKLNSEKLEFCDNTIKEKSSSRKIDDNGNYRIVKDKLFNDVNREVNTLPVKCNSNEVKSSELEDPICTASCSDGTDHLSNISDEISEVIVDGEIENNNCGSVKNLEVMINDKIEKKSQSVEEIFHNYAAKEEQVVGSISGDKNSDADTLRGAKEIKVVDDVEISIMNSNERHVEVITINDDTKSLFENSEENSDETTKVATLPCDLQSTVMNIGSELNYVDNEVVVTSDESVESESDELTIVSCNIRGNEVSTFSEKTQNDNSDTQNNDEEVKPSGKNAVNNNNNNCDHECVDGDRDSVIKVVNSSSRINVRNDLLKDNDVIGLSQDNKVHENLVSSTIENISTDFSQGNDNEQPDSFSRTNIINKVVKTYGNCKNKNGKSCKVLRMYVMNKPKDGSDIGKKKHCTTDSDSNRLINVKPLPTSKCGNVKKLDGYNFETLVKKELLKINFELLVRIKSVNGNDHVNKGNTTRILTTPFSLQDVEKIKVIIPEDGQLKVSCDNRESTSVLLGEDQYILKNINDRKTHKVITLLQHVNTHNRNLSKSKTSNIGKYTSKNCDYKVEKLCYSRVLEIWRPSNELFVTFVPGFVVQYGSDFNTNLQSLLSKPIQKLLKLKEFSTSDCDGLKAVLNSKVIDVLKSTDKAVKIEFVEQESGWCYSVE